MACIEFSYHSGAHGYLAQHQEAAAAEEAGGKFGIRQRHRRH